MKMITAMVRPAKVDAIKTALVALDIIGMTVTDSRGFGRQKGQIERYRGTEFTVEFLPKARVEIVVPEAKLDAAVAAVTEAAHTGEIGDGKIFITTVESAIRIRTGESGEASL
ncbi:P-II family nitrogen regulator [Synechococcus sp. CCY 9618]|uniref:P-II family nitrogen regulator n=1 Tax=Synechococcus sp. CCY 9618 TaxID=2815602 RepID=UPI001C24EADE|nr:P-II family nitrogen regulator [Synechococcus sp. CCY 9618]